MAKFTQQAILVSFRKLLNEKKLDQITVKDIVEDCGINRKTFYYYYRDIVALTEDLFTRELEQIHTAFAPPEHAPQDAQQALLRFMADNRRLMLNIYRSSGYEQLSRSLRGLSRGFLLAQIGEMPNGAALRDTDVRLLADMLDAALAGMLARWFDDGMPDTSPDLLTRAGALLDGVFPLMLDNCRRLTPAPSAETSDSPPHNPRQNSDK